MELRHVRYFLAVAEELHFGRAARRLHISQPPLSQQIRELESEIGATLFDRSERRVRLTPAGEVFLRSARELLERAGAMVREARAVAQGELGTLHIGYTTTAMYLLLPRLLSRFRAAHPEIGVRLVELASGAQGAQLRAGTLDVGFVCLPTDVDGLWWRAAAHDTLLAALPENHALAAKKRLTIAELLSAPFVTVRPDAEPGWSRAIEGAIQESGAALQVVQTADTKLSLLGLVAAGIGVTIVSSSLAALGRPGVVFRKLSGSRTRLALGVVAPSSRPLLTRRLLSACQLD